MTGAELLNITHIIIPNIISIKNSTFCLAGDLRVAIRYEEPESHELERRVQYQSTEPSFQYSQ